MNYTINEQQVFNLIASISFDGSVADMADITASIEGMTPEKARGVIASLVKKGRVSVDDEIAESIVYWPVHPEHGACFLVDCIDEDEFEALLISDEDTKELEPMTDDEPQGGEYHIHAEVDGTTVEGPCTEDFVVKMMRRKASLIRVRDYAGFEVATFTRKGPAVAFMNYIEALEKAGQ